ncbi:MAG: peptidase C69 [Promethearchaeota archaeon]
MCDTFVALGNSTLDGNVIFGKNSDRPNTEAQLITYSPRMKYPKGDELKCTYISIPQTNETSEIILSQPWWMWGAEMGANEYNVVIGNEAIYTHEPLRDIGLLGMDLLRLGLERGKTAKEAMDIIIALLEKYGQGGGCAYDDSSWSYHNSFLIADPHKAYVLETADMWWIGEEVKDVRSISNNISIRGKGDFRRRGIIQHAIEKNYCIDDDDFDFAFTFSGSPISEQPSPYSRNGKSTILLKKNKRKITSKLMMDFLREHEAGICMHGGFESTGSQVSHLRKEGESIHWFTGSTLPCLSLFKPYFFPIDKQNVLEPGPYSKVNPEWFWSRHANEIKFTGVFRLLPKREQYIKILESNENEIIQEVNDVLSEDTNIIDKELKERKNAINWRAWEISKKLIN